ncbi:MAG: VOC family protein [Neomegalonema sp.]|nr:VOC family protein [Neomegalonema sp.]
MMSAKVSTCLWFDGNAEEAARFYVDLIPQSDIGEITRISPEAPALVIEFTLGGAPYQAFNGGKRPGFTEGASIVIRTDDQEETDRLWTALAKGGGKPGRCGWLKDRYGLSWQIIPNALSELLAKSDPAATARVAQALAGMHKIDISALEAAHRDG